MQLTGPKRSFALGQLTELASDPKLDASRGECDYIRLRFFSLNDLENGDLQGFLQAHVAALAATDGAKPKRYADLAS